MKWKTYFLAIASSKKSSSFDELYGLGFTKVILPAQFGKTGFNPVLLE